MSAPFTTPVFTCEFCQNTYGYKSTLLRHQNICGPFSTHFDCKICSKSFLRRDVLQKHIRSQHKDSPSNITSSQSFTCHTCSETFPSAKTLVKHTRQNHLNQQSGGGPAKRRKTNTANQQSCSRQALNGTVREFDFIPRGEEGNDPYFYFVKIQPDIIHHLKTEVETKRSIKWGLCTQIRFSKTDADGLTSFTEPYFKTKMSPATLADDLDELYTEATNTLMKLMDSYEGDSSNLNFENVLSVKLSVVKFQPFRGSSYLPLPPSLVKKRCLLNINNVDDDMCFVYCVLAHLFPVPTNLVREQVYHYKDKIHELDLKGCSFPMCLNHISKFEKANNLSINVYGLDEDEKRGDEIYPLRVSSDMTHLSKDRHIDLLLITQEVEEEDVPPLSHYVLITSLPALVRAPGDGNTKFICRKCMWTFRSEHTLLNHAPYCYHKAQRIKMPAKDKAFRSFGLGQYAKMVKVPFVIYCDFESVLSPLERNEASSGGSTHVQEHIPCGYSYQIVCREPDLYTFPLRTYSSEQTAEHFMTQLLKDYDSIMEILNHCVPIKLTREETLAIDLETCCYLCGEEVQRHERHIDHDHITGRVRGLCHNRCNVNYNESKFVNVICHNASRYDNHIILQAAELFADRKLKCIAQNSEHFIMFQIDQLRFLDSYKFLNTSLQTLADNLRSKGQDEFVYLAKNYPEHVDLLTRKLPYFYEYVDSFEKLNQTKFPSRDQFYSSLTEETVSEDDYAFARRIWDTFEITSVREFMELYVAVDTLILTDVFEAFRDMCLSYYELDPCQYFTLPGMAMDACLLKTGVNLDLMIDPDMYNFVSNAIRGGVASINHRYARANNKRMSDFDPSKPESYLYYFDINNLYGASMSCPLPQGHFAWVDEAQIDGIDWAQLDPEGNMGYILECDLQYPQHLHSMHQSLPLAPTKENISFEDLSPYHRQLLAELGLLGKNNMKKPPTGTKLFTTLKDKQHYVIHFVTLQQYLQLGLKLTKVHKVLTFTQSKWMKPYIDFNTQKRKEATDNFSKDLFKLLSNSVYGKQLQNVRNYSHIELITTEERRRKYTAKCNFKSAKIFSEHLVVVSMEKVSVTLNQPVAVGFSILEHAKRLLYDFHYNVMLKAYASERVRVLMTDTDSLFYQIWSPVGTPLRDPQDFMLANPHLFDTSNYPGDHPLHSMERHKAIGLMKDEVGGRPIREFVGLRPKNYSFVFDKTPSERVEKRTAKGVQKAFVRKHLRHQMYKDCLFDHKQNMATYHQIRSIRNTLYTDKVTKLALSPQDDKRYILTGGIESRPYGFNPIV